jgi:hypothetical protein
MTTLAGRALTARAYDRTGGGELWTELPCAVQDYLARLVDKAVELHEADTACATCGERGVDLVCEDCYNGKHAETCHDCKREIPIATQRCAGCVAEIVRTELRASSVPDAVIERLCHLLDAL